MNEVTMLFVLLFAGAVFVSAAIGLVPLEVPAVYLALSLITFVMYAIDKSAAQRGAWRISEATLQLFALAGGWPGALIGQKLVRCLRRIAPTRVSAPGKR